MRFEIRKHGPIEPPGAQIGDVFPARGGPGDYRKATRYWLIAAESPGRFGGRVVHCLGLSEEGAIVSTTSYGSHVFDDRPRVGYCADMASAEFQIEWADER